MASNTFLFGQIIPTNEKCYNNPEIDSMNIVRFSLRLLPIAFFHWQSQMRLLLNDVTDTANNSQLAPQHILPFHNQ